MRLPAALITLPLLIGVVAGLMAADNGMVVAPASAAAAGLAWLAAVGAFSLAEPALTVVAAALGCTLAGASLADSAAQEVYRPSLLRWFEARGPDDGAVAVVIEGRLREDAAWSGPVASMILAVDRIQDRDARTAARPVSGGVRLSIAGAPAPARLSEWRAGRRIRAPVFLRLPTTYVDPGVGDERRALARRGVVLVGTAKSAMLVDVEARGSARTEVAGAVRAWVRATLAAAIGRWSERSAAIATAVLIGDRSGLPDADTRRLQDAGTYHVIAISGGNIAILTLLLLGLFAVVGMPIPAAAALTMLVLLAYRDVVVSSPSVERAINAALLYLTARLLDHRGAALNVLAVAAGIGLALTPVVLLDAGFLLSFGATLGILVAAGARSPPARGAPLADRVWREAVSLCRTTLAAEAALLPISALLFGRVTLAGVALNLVAIPLMSVLQTAAMAALALSAASRALAAGSGLVAHWAAVGILESARLTDMAPWLAFDVPAPRAAVVAVYYAAAVCWLAARSVLVARGAAVAGAAAAAAIVAGPAWAANVLDPPAAGVRVVVLDVGQGDATAIVLPGGRAVLVDAGGAAAAMPVDPAGGEPGGFDIGQRVVVPALRALGVRRLEALTITHGDPDHLGGVPGVLRGYRPASIWDGVPVPPHAPLRLVSELADTLGVPWRTVQAGDATRVGPVLIRVLHPPLPDWERQRVRNEDSVVLDVRIGGVSIVLPGDIGAEGERAVLAHWLPARTVILKAAHHGSATSSTVPFVDALAPAAVIFSAGRANRFGHPAPAVVDRYRQRGIPTFSTAESGAIVVETDGRTTSLRGWAGDRSLTIPTDHR